MCNDAAWTVGIIYNAGIAAIGVLEHEKHVSKLIDELVQVASEEKDNATQNFLWQFVREQVEDVIHALIVLADLVTRRREEREQDFVFGMLLADAFDDAAVFEDHDGVGVADGGQAVRDHKRGASAQQIQECGGILSVLLQEKKEESFKDKNA